MLTELEEHSETFNKELENIKNNQSELKNTITEMKNVLEKELTAEQGIRKNAKMTWKIR